MELNGSHPHYPNNYISTAKYNAFTFLPRALFEQCVDKTIAAARRLLWWPPRYGSRG